MAMRCRRRRGRSPLHRRRRTSALALGQRRAGRAYSSGAGGGGLGVGVGAGSDQWATAPQCSGGTTRRGTKMSATPGADSATQKCASRGNRSLAITRTTRPSTVSRLDPSPPPPPPPPTCAGAAATGGAAAAPAVGQAAAAAFIGGTELNAAAAVEAAAAAGVRKTETVSFETTRSSCRRHGGGPVISRAQHGSIGAGSRLQPRAVAAAHRGYSHVTAGSRSEAWAVSDETGPGVWEGVRVRVRVRVRRVRRLDGGSCSGTSTDVPRACPL